MERGIFYMRANGHWCYISYNPKGETLRLYVDGVLEHRIEVLPKFNI